MTTAHCMVLWTEMQLPLRLSLNGEIIQAQLYSAMLNGRLQIPSCAFLALHSGQS